LVIKTETILKSHDVWDHVEFGFSEPNDEAMEQSLCINAEGTMKERQKEECISIAAYPTWSGPSSVLENYDNVFNRYNMGGLGDKL